MSIVRRAGAASRPALLLLVLASCGTPPAPLPPMAEAKAGERLLRLACEASEVRYRASVLPSGCERRITISGGALPLVVTATDTGASCRDVRAGCAATTGEIAVRPEGSLLKVALLYRGPRSGWSTQYLVEPAGLWVLGDGGEGAGTAPQAMLDAMPPLDAAVDARLAAERGPGAISRTIDGVWELLADPAAAGRHVPRLSELARDCRLDEPVARALLAAAPDAVRDVYAGALRESCEPQRAALAAAKAGAVRDLIAADLAASSGPTSAADVALGDLAAHLGLKELAVPLAARLVLPDPPPPGFNDETLTSWARLGGSIDALDGDAATPARLEALGWAQGPAYTGCETPTPPSQAATYMGYPPGFALFVAIDLLPHGTPEVRDAVFAIAGDDARSGSARQMARFLLASWRDPRAATIVGVELNACQQEQLRQGP